MRLEDLLYKLDSYKETLRTFDVSHIVNSATDPATKLHRLKGQQQQLQTLKKQMEADISCVQHTYQTIQDDRIARILYSTLADYDLIKTCASNILLQIEMMQRQLMCH